MAAPGAENEEAVQQVVQVGGRTFLVVDHLGDGYSGTVLKAYNVRPNVEAVWNERVGYRAPKSPAKEMLVQVDPVTIETEPSNALTPEMEVQLDQVIAENADPNVEEPEQAQEAANDKIPTSLLALHQPTSEQPIWWGSLNARDKQGILSAYTEAMRRHRKLEEAARTIAIAEELSQKWGLTEMQVRDLPSLVYQEVDLTQSKIPQWFEERDPNQQDRLKTLYRQTMLLCDKIPYRVFVEFEQQGISIDEIEGLGMICAKEDHEERAGMSRIDDFLVVCPEERNKKFALKVMYKDEKTWNPRSSPDRLRREIVCLKGLSHPNIVKLYGYDMDCVIEDRECVVLLFEVLSKGELFDYISPSDIFTHGQVRYMIKEIMSGLKAVHDQGFAHRDIKLQNIMLNKNYGVKLIDFGFLQKFKNPETGAQQRMRSTLGTKCYVAPEVSSGNYTEKCDIFSAGVVSFILLASAPPFGEHGDWWHGQIMRENWDRFWSQHSRRPNVEYTDEFKEMIEGMLCPNPDNRWSVDQVLDCAYLEAEITLKQEFCTIMGQRRSRLKTVQQTAALVQATQEGSVTDGLESALTQPGQKKMRAVDSEVHKPCCGKLNEHVDCVVLTAKDLLTNDWRQKFEECKNDADAWKETMNEFVAEFPDHETFKEITESLPEDNLQQLVDGLATKTIHEVEEVGAMFNLDVEQENDFNAVHNLMGSLSTTNSNLMWHQVFPRYVAKEEEFPLREFPEKMGVDTTNTFFTKLSFGLMCVVLDNFMDGKGEIYVQAEQRTIVLNFAVPKTETFPGEDGEEDEEFEYTVKFEVGVKMFKVVEDKQDSRVHVKNQAVFENRTRNIMALEEYQWVVETISTLPEVIGTYVDPDIMIVQ